MGWWGDVGRGKEMRVVVLQVDLGGHSNWLNDVWAKNIRAAFEARATFSSRLNETLSFERFDRIAWAGDGGFFVLGPDGRPDDVCGAADRVFDLFREWREARPVELRVSATYLEIAVDKEPGNWCSPELNEFLKYERQIARTNAFVITAALYQRLSLKEAARFERIDDIFLSGAKKNIALFIDTKNRGKVERSARSFGSWLRKQSGEGGHSVVALGKDLVQMGLCTVLNTPLRATGYGEIVLEPTSSVSAAESVDEEIRAQWQKERAELVDAKVRGTSARVLSFFPEITDDPLPRLQYSHMDYCDARAFLKLQESDNRLAQKYRDQALEVLGRQGTTLPNILSTAGVVIIGDAAPELVIAHRWQKTTGGFHDNCWAVTIGEQFIPETGYRGARMKTADASVEDSIVRGLREELTGVSYTGHVSASVHAFCMEDWQNNFIFLAILNLRPLTFDQLAKQWYTAEDRFEHDAIAAIPATSEVLKTCVGSSELPRELWNGALGKQRVAFAQGCSAGSLTGHSWQANSHVRLGLADWFVNEESMR